LPDGVSGRVSSRTKALGIMYSARYAASARRSVVPSGDTDAVDAECALLPAGSSGSSVK